MRDLQEQAGHANAATTLRYAQASDALGRRERKSSCPLPEIWKSPVNAECRNRESIPALGKLPYQARSINLSWQRQPHIAVTNRQRYRCSAPVI